jgi:uncharacterized protein (TIGR02597 family)
MHAPSNAGRASSLHHVTLIFASIAIFTAVAQVALADACSSSPGSLTIPYAAGSSTYASIPFTRTPAFCGYVSNISANTITVVDDSGNTPNLTTSTPGPDSYYVVITSGTKEGAIYSTNASIAMTSDTVTVNPPPYPPPGSCEDLTGVATTGTLVGSANVGDQIAIIPYWTLNTVFPNGDYVTHGVATTATQILVPSIVSGGIVYSVYYYAIASKTLSATWKNVALGNANANNQSLQPNVYFIVAQPGPAGGSFTVSGQEVQYTTRTCLVAQPTGGRNKIIPWRTITIIRPDPGRHLMRPGWPTRSLRQVQAARQLFQS